ncbi:MAG: T9SS type A sorting domain-containing protein [Bacteroidetes bacterium]|nr:T9SS type A sorting domain-containing protein [Bacteroidota bacterium]
MKKLYSIIFIVFFSSVAHAQWDSIYTGTNSSVTNIFFTSDMLGYAAGASNLVVKTINGGSTWANVAPVASVNYSDIYFLNADTGFLSVSTMTGDPYYFKTSDGGANWTDISAACGIFSQGANDLEFINSTIGFAVGGLGAGTYIGKTINGGNTYLSTANPSLDPLLCITFINSSVGFLADNGGKIFKTVNMGLSWNLSYSGSPVIDFTQIYFVTDSIGFATTGSGVALKTVDQGANWSIQSIGNYLTSVVFVNSNTGYISSLGGSNQNYLYKTTDGGTTWNIDGTISGYLRKYALFKTPDNTIFLAADSGVIYRDTSFVTGISNNTSQNFSVNVFPNPSPDGRFAVNSSQFNIKRADVYNVMGETVYSAIQPFNHTTIDISNQPQGIYFLQVKTENGIANKKIIINK